MDPVIYVVFTSTSCFVALFCSKNLHVVVSLTLSLCRDDQLWWEWILLLGPSSLLIYWCFSSLAQRTCWDLFCLPFILWLMNDYTLWVCHIQRHSLLYQLSETSNFWNHYSQFLLLLHWLVGPHNWKQQSTFLLYYYSSLRNLRIQHWHMHSCGRM